MFSKVATFFLTLPSRIDCRALIEPRFTSHKPFRASRFFSFFSISECCDQEGTRTRRLTSGCCNCGCSIYAQLAPNLITSQWYQSNYVPRTLSMESTRVRYYRMSRPSPSMVAINIEECMHVFGIVWSSPWRLRSISFVRRCKRPARRRQHGFSCPND